MTSPSHARFGVVGVAALHAFGLVTMIIASMFDLPVLQATAVGGASICAGWARLFSETLRVSTRRRRRIYLVAAGVTLPVASWVWLVVGYQFSLLDGMWAALGPNLVVMGFSYFMRSQDVSRWRTPPSVDDAQSSRPGRHLLKPARNH